MNNKFLYNFTLTIEEVNEVLQALNVKVEKTEEFRNRLYHIAQQQEMAAAAAKNENTPEASQASTEPVETTTFTKGEVTNEG